MTSAGSIFADDYRDTVYWWDHSPAPRIEPASLPEKVDVLVIGSGYTGLCAALQTARAGRDTLVVDAGALGHGCSTRNGGQVTNVLKPSLAALGRKYGAERALKILQEGPASMEFLKAFIAEESIDCDLRANGKFRAAHSRAQYEAMARQYAHQKKGLEQQVDMVPRAEQHREIGSQLYHGGAVIHSHFALDPAKYHSALLLRAKAAGARLIGDCAARQVRPDGSAFRVETALGMVKARDVIVATNGYSDTALPWFRRRVIPIGSYVIATELLPQDTVHELLPNDRIVTDSRKLVYYYRASSDRRRILFGGRVSLSETNPRISAPLLRAELVRLFPQIEDVKLSYSWMGYVAFTFDSMPHIGQHDGLHYAMGYCGSGIATASYLGTKLGLKVLGSPDAATALDETSFSTRSFYFGNPWFLAPTVHYYRLLDRIGR